MEKKKKQQSLPLERWELSGKICLGSRWNDDKAHPFRINFLAYGPPHARKIGLERLKAFARREKEAEGEKELLLDGVFLINGSSAFSLSQRFANKGILYVKQAQIVFESLKT